MNKKGNISSLKPFKEGKDERRNTNGANKGSKWKRTLLKEILTTELSDRETQLFQSIKQRFPRFFQGSEEQNFQLFMELRQVQLVFSKDERVAQTAIREIKDRVEGKSEQVTKVDVTTKGEAINEKLDFSEFTIDELVAFEKLHKKAHKKAHKNKDYDKY